MHKDIVLRSGRAFGPDLVDWVLLDRHERGTDGTELFRQQTRVTLMIMQKARTRTFHSESFSSTP